MGVVSSEIHKNVINEATLFWGIKQPKSVIPYRRYETKYGSNLHVSKIQ